jgi:hypothetical protein
LCAAAIEFNENGTGSSSKCRGKSALCQIFLE